MNSPKCDNKKNNLLTIVLILSLLVSLIVIVVLIVVLLFFLLTPFSTPNASNNEERNVYQYQYLQHDPETKETSRGYLTLSTRLEKEEFQSYIEDGKQVLVSNFGAEEYQCSGTCGCDDEERRNAGVVSRSITVLIAAFTSALAIERASQHFVKECQNQLTECPVEDQVTSVEKCESVFNIPKMELPAEEGSKYDFLDSSRKRFLCRGWCVYRHDYVENHLPWTNNGQMKDPCVEFLKVAQVHVYESGNIYRDYDNARKKFRLLHLHKYCNYQRPDYDALGENAPRDRKECSAGSRVDDNIHCRLENVSKIPKQGGNGY